MNSPRLLTFVRKRLLFLAYASLAAVILGELGRFYWLLELFSHFVPLHAVFLWLGVCASSTTRSRLLFGLVAALLTGWMLTPRTDAPTQTQQRFISYNLYINNPHIGTDLNWLEGQSADVVFLTEATPSMHIVQRLQAAYPHGCERLDDSPFGLILLSKQALKIVHRLTTRQLARFPRHSCRIGQRPHCLRHPPAATDFALHGHRARPCVAKHCRASTK